MFSFFYFFSFFFLLLLAPTYQVINPEAICFPFFFFHFLCLFSFSFSWCSKPEPPTPAAISTTSTTGCHPCWWALSLAESGEIHIPNIVFSRDHNFNIGFGQKESESNKIGHESDGIFAKNYCSLLVLPWLTPHHQSPSRLTITNTPFLSSFFSFPHPPYQSIISKNLDPI